MGSASLRRSTVFHNNVTMKLKKNSHQTVNTSIKTDEKMLYIHLFLTKSEHLQKYIYDGVPFPEACNLSEIRSELMKYSRCFH